MKKPNKLKRQLLKYLRTRTGIKDATTLWESTRAWVGNNKTYAMSGEYAYYADHISVIISSNGEREEFKVYLKELVKPVKRKLKGFRFQVKKKRTLPTHKKNKKVKK